MLVQEPSRSFMGKEQEGGGDCVYFVGVKICPGLCALCIRVICVRIRKPSLEGVKGSLKLPPQPVAVVSCFHILLIISKAWHWVGLVIHVSP